MKIFCCDILFNLQICYILNMYKLIHHFFHVLNTIWVIPRLPITFASLRHEMDVVLDSC